jgi:hypothetical protein
MKGERMELAVAEKEEAAIYVVCKETNSIVRMPRFLDGRYALKELPKGMKVQLVSVKINHGKPQLAMQEATVGEKKPFEMTYRDVTLPEMRNALARLNG